MRAVWNSGQLAVWDSAADADDGRPYSVAGGVGGAVDELVDVLRDQSYLMHQRDDEGNWGYKLTSCRFGSGSTTQGSLARSTQRRLAERLR